MRFARILDLWLDDFIRHDDGTRCEILHSAVSPVLYALPVPSSTICAADTGLSTEDSQEFSKPLYEATFDAMLGL
jgi:hypothetical protein